MKLPPIIGLDLSLVGTGACILPAGWDGNWEGVFMDTIGRKLPSGSSTQMKIARLQYITESIVSLAREHGIQNAAVESYPFGKTNAAHALGEIAGAMKVRLTDAGIRVTVAPISTARKLLLGHLPKPGAKIAVRDMVVRLGGCPRTLDEADAFCAASWLSAELGGPYFSSGSLMTRGAA